MAGPCVDDSDSVVLAIEPNGHLQAGVRVSGAAGNQLSLSPAGLFVPPGAGGGPATQSVQSVAIAEGGMASDTFTGSGALPAVCDGFTWNGAALTVSKPTFFLASFGCGELIGFPDPSNGAHDATGVLWVAEVMLISDTDGSRIDGTQMRTQPQVWASVPNFSSGDVRVVRWPSLSVAWAALVNPGAPAHFRIHAYARTQAAASVDAGRKIDLSYGSSTFAWIGVA